MRSEPRLDWIRVESHAELDVLVGRYITGEDPAVHWEDSHAHMRFESAEEALDALREPYFQQFIPLNVRASTVLREIQEFSPYSSDLETAWQVVDKVANSRQALRLWHDQGLWFAAFGELPPAGANTAPAAICLAALRLRGLEVALGNGNEAPESGGTVV